jgi:hypothetical protein
MDDISTDWTQWTPPYDPRQVNGAVVNEDEHGRLIGNADCGERCPGCGICCAGYRDVITADYFGVEEFEGNLKMGRGGLVKLDDGTWYRVPHCGESCPGYGRCCPPFDLRQRPETVADARRVLLERDDGQRWEMQEALLILAHSGSDEAVEVLEAYMPRAHVRLEGFAGCALDEGRYFASIPRNAEEERMMLKQDVLRAWGERAVDAWAKISDEIEPRLERKQYELEIAQRLLEKAEDDEARSDWQIQVDVLGMLVGMLEGDLAEQQEELALCDAMIAEIEADIAADEESLERK